MIPNKEILPSFPSHFLSVSFWTFAWYYSLGILWSFLIDQVVPCTVLSIRNLEIGNKDESIVHSYSNLYWIRVSLVTVVSPVCDRCYWDSTCTYILSFISKNGQCCISSIRPTPNCNLHNHQNKFCVYINILTFYF